MNCYLTPFYPILGRWAFNGGHLPALNIHSTAAHRLVVPVGLGPIENALIIVASSTATTHDPRAHRSPPVWLPVRCLVWLSIDNNNDAPCRTVGQLYGVAKSVTEKGTWYGREVWKNDALCLQHIIRQIIWWAWLSCSTVVQCNAVLYSAVDVECLLSEWFCLRIYLTLDELVDFHAFHATLDCLLCYNFKMSESRPIVGYPQKNAIHSLFIWIEQCQNCKLCDWSECIVIDLFRMLSQTPRHENIKKGSGSGNRAVEAIKSIWVGF